MSRGQSTIWPLIFIYCVCVFVCVCEGAHKDMWMSEAGTSVRAGRPVSFRDCLISISPVLGLHIHTSGFHMLGAGDRTQVLRPAWKALCYGATYAGPVLLYKYDDIINFNKFSTERSKVKIVKVKNRSMDWEERMRGRTQVFHDYTKC